MNKKFKLAKQFKGVFKKGGNNMTLLTKSCDRLILIDKEKSDKFLEDSKKNVIKPEILAECKKLSSMFKRENIGYIRENNE